MEGNHSIQYDILENRTDLDHTERELFILAEKQAQLAYAPYSHFHVGTAILLDNGLMIGGSNQENASYPLCMCAERVALYSAISMHPEARPVKMVIVAHNPNLKTDKPIPPCGACRQVILEYEFRFKQAIQILLRDDNGKFYRFEGARTLLPLAFDGSFLEK